MDEIKNNCKMNEKILISVIVPVYKSEELLPKCIESILAQSYDCFELILVDDGSPDRSGEICDNFQKKDKRIKTIHKQNGGASDARNRGIEEASGVFISFVDSDDYLEACFLENAVSKIGGNDCYISGIKMYGGNFESEYVSQINGVYSVKELYERVFIDVPQICVSGPCCKLYNSEIIKKNNIRFDPSIRCGEDCYFVLSFMWFAKNVFLDDQSYYNYFRGNSDSLFSSYNKQSYEDNVKVYEKWLELICQIKCAKETIQLLKQRYVGALINNISSAFKFKCEKTEKKRVIEVLSKDKMINSNIEIKGKDKLIKFLLKHNFVFTVYMLFSLRYCN